MVARPNGSGASGLGPLKDKGGQSCCSGALTLETWLTYELRIVLWGLASHFYEFVCNIRCEDGAFTSCN